MELNLLLSQEDTARLIVLKEQEKNCKGMSYELFAMVLLSDTLHRLHPANPLQDEN